ncbi:hypothetical protein WICPIJ_001389, partial [Wickerhamomyces pijperi]
YTIGKMYSLKFYLDSITVYLPHLVQFKIPIVTRTQAFNKMLTPYFACSQDETHINIDIKISHIRFDAVGVQTIVQDDLFIFSLSPYYLRLRFPCELIDDEDHPAKAEFVLSEDCVKVKVWKKNKGEHFSDLEFSQKLLARLGEDVDKQQEALSSEELLQQIGVKSDDKELLRQVGDLDPPQKQQQQQTAPLIQEISSTNNDLIQTEEQGSQFSWELPQQMQPQTAEPIATQFKYGFQSQYDTIIGISISNGNDINELSDPEHTVALDRIKERLSREDFKFDVEYYAADYMTTKYSDEDEYNTVKELIQWPSEQFITGSLTNNTDGFTKEQDEQMLRLGSYKQKALIDDPKPLYYTILSLSFATLFEIRSTQGELTTESAWGIGKLTPQIANLDLLLTHPELYEDSTGNGIDMIKLVIVTAIRRALAFPLARNFELCIKVWFDVIEVLKNGKMSLVKLLLIAHEAFRFHDVYYVYCKVLLDDLVKWVIANDQVDFVVKSLAGEVERVLMNELKKSDIRFDKLEEGENGEQEIVTLDIAEIEALAEGISDWEFAESTCVEEDEVSQRLVKSLCIHIPANLDSLNCSDCDIILMYLVNRAMTVWLRDDNLYLCSVKTNETTIHEASKRDSEIFEPIVLMLETRTKINSKEN